MRACGRGRRRSRICSPFWTRTRFFAVNDFLLKRTRTLPLLRLVLFYFVMFMFMLITLPNVWGLREQATQKDTKIVYRDLLRGTLGLCLVLPRELHCYTYCYCLTIYCAANFRGEYIWFDLIWLFVFDVFRWQISYSISLKLLLLRQIATN